MDKRNKLTIVTLTYNNFDELKKTIETCRKLPRTENLVINGGYCEETLKFLESNKLRHISEPDDGISDAFNKGLKEARTPYIMYLNSGDELINHDYIQESIDLLERNNKIGYTHAKLIFDSDSQRGKITFTPNKKNIGFGMKFLHPTMITRTYLLTKVGGFSKSYRIAMDYHVSLKLYKMKVKGKYFNKTTVLMDGKGVSSKNEIKSLGESLRAILSNGFIDPRVYFFWFLRFLKIIMKNYLLPEKVLLIYSRVKK